MSTVAAVVNQSIFNQYALLLSIVPVSLILPLPCNLSEYALYKRGFIIVKKP